MLETKRYPLYENTTKKSWQRGRPMQPAYADVITRSINQIFCTGKRQSAITVDKLVCSTQILGLFTDEFLKTADLKRVDPDLLSILSARLRNDKRKRLFLKLLIICKQLMEQAR